MSPLASQIISPRSEAQFLGFDQTPLYFQKWSAKAPKATIIVTHGQAEHSGCYNRLAEALNPLEVDIYAWDLRGHGKSAGLRGYVENFSDYSKDYEIFLSKLTTERQLLSKPLFLLAHSMGGLIQAKTLCDHPHLPITAQVLASPMFGLSVQVPAIKDMAARYLNLLLPRLTLGNELKYSDLTRDVAVIREFNLDVLRHDRISSGAYLGSLSAMSELMAKATQITLPTLMLISENDPVVSTAAAREIFEKLGSDKKVLNLYPDRKHELFNDLDREEVFADIRKFLASYV